jgi:hypothetical protein
MTWLQIEQVGIAGDDQVDAHGRVRRRALGHRLVTPDGRRDDRWHDRYAT